MGKEDRNKALAVLKTKREKGQETNGLELHPENLALQTTRKTSRNH